MKAQQRGEKLDQIYLRIGDQYEQIQAGINLAVLDASASLDQKTTFRLALITTFQFHEALPDPAAAEASMKRRDWKTALHLPSKHPGISAPALCKFRESLVFSAMALSEFELLLGRLEHMGLFEVQREELNPREILVGVCMITRFEHLNQAMKTALSCLVSIQPDWLSQVALPHWYERYKTGRREQKVYPIGDAMQEEAIHLGKDMKYLLSAIEEKGLSDAYGLMEIQTISRLLKNEFILTGKRVVWRGAICTACECRT
jgi:hypothetical protein